MKVRDHFRIETRALSRRGSVLGLVLAVLSGPCLTPSAVHAEASEIRIGIQPGLTYLALNVMQDLKLIEKHAAAAGLGTVTSSWQKVAAGNDVNDAVLSGALDVGCTGVPAFMLLWAKTKSQLAMRGFSPFNSLPLVLITRNPNVKTIADLTATDRIALPGARASSQALLLQIAAAKAFGEAEFKRFDSLAVSRGHPDAMAAFLSGSEINHHFTAAPYLQQELKHPGVRIVTTSTEIYGRPGTIGVTFGTTKFHDANPKLSKAFIAAIEEAMELIKADKRKAAESYLRVTGEKVTADELAAMLSEPGMLYEPTPRGTLQVAEFMHRTGTIAVKPDSWKDLFFPDIHGRDGD